MNEAIDMYLSDKLARGKVLPQSAKTERFRLNSMLSSAGDSMVDSVTPDICQALYDALAASGKSVDTCLNTLAVTKSFFTWCAKKNYTAVNPMADIEGFGRRKTGKEQLRIDEARKVLALALASAEERDASAVAVAAVLALGIRASECANIEARDIDNDGTVLVIPKAKTAAGIRRLAIPEALQAPLGSLAVSGRLFPGKDRHWVLYHVKRLCRLAGVPEITAHGLRGTHATLATNEGATGQFVMAALGHNNSRVTERHYTKPEATAAARIRATFKVLEGGSK